MNSLKIDNIIKDKKGLKSTFKTENEGYIVLPVVYEKYWNIKVDGEEVQATIVNGGLTAIYVEEGNHSLEMSYNFYYKGIGILISLSTLIIIILYKIDVKRYLRIKKEVEN